MKQDLKIVVLDGDCANPGDLSWSKFESIADVTAYPFTKGEDVLERAKDADIILDNKVMLTAEILRGLPNLKYVGLLSTGYNVVDIREAKRLSIPVCNVPEYSTKSVAQHTFALMTSLAANLCTHVSSVKEGDWQKCDNFCYRKGNIVELAGKTLGIIGYGSIGRAVAKIANAMGMKVIAYKRHIHGKESGVEMVTLEELIRRSDVISLHCDLNEENANMVDSEFLSKVKQGVMIINTARGGLVDEQAMRQALESGKVAGFGADVLCEEPPKQGSVLIGAPNCIITPHIAWASKEARQRLLDAAFANIEAFLEGNPINIVY